MSGVQILELPPSGKTAVAGTFTTTSNSAGFAPIAGRDFNIKIGTAGAATSNSTALQRSFDGGTTYDTVTYPDGSLVVWTVGVNTSWNESETQVLYRLANTGTTSMAYRISQ